MSVPKAAFASTRIPILGNILQFGTWVAPTTTLYLVGQDTRTEIRENIMNGNFSDGLVGWLVKGTVQADGQTAVLSPTQTPSSIEQVLPSDALGLTFEFRATDQLSLDDVVFNVSYNNIPLYEAKQLSTNWQRITVRLPQTDSIANTLLFYAEADARITPKPFHIELRNISTRTAIGTEQTLFSLTNDSPIETTTVIATPNGTILSAHETTKFPLISGTIQYWSEDQEKNKETPQSLPVDIRSQSVPKPIILEVRQHPSNEGSITFLQESPEHGQIQSFDLRQGEGPISKETALSTLTLVNFSEESIHTPIMQKEDYLVFPLKNSHQPFYGALRAIDQYGNYSEPEFITL